MKLYNQGLHYWQTEAMRSNKGVSISQSLTLLQPIKITFVPFAEPRVIRCMSFFIHPPSWGIWDQFQASRHLWDFLGWTPRTLGAKTSLPWLRSESSNMWKNAFFHPNFFLVTLQPCFSLVSLHARLWMCGYAWPQCDPDPLLHGRGTDLWEQAAVHGLNQQSSIWRMYAVV